MAAEILERIIGCKRQDVARSRAQVSFADVTALAKDAPPVRDFTGALARPGQVNLIAEIKRASPSKGVIRADFDPVAIARAYAHGGAGAISVLTDRSFFQGDLGFVAMAKDAVPLPVLRKDFIIDAYQLYESRWAGADAVLLIAAVLARDTLRRCLDLAAELGLHCLVEVHDERELDSVLETDARLIGVNNRNLHTFETTLETTDRLGPRVPRDRALVSESGIFTRDDVARVAAAGARAVLVGEALMRDPEIIPSVRELVGVPR